MDTRKIIQALAYIAYKEPDHIIDNVKAYKLLWLADRYHVRHTGRFITGDTYYAMPRGPVPSDAKSILEGKTPHLLNDSQYMSRYIQPLDKSYRVIAEPDTKVFSISDRNAMDMAYSVFNDMDTETISTFSHQFPEWLAYKDKIEDDNQNSSYPIDVDLFFENSSVDDRGFFADNSEALNLAKDLYHESHRL